MAVFKCKMCGGTLEINNNESVATCEYCGTKQTLPNLDDEKRVQLYDRANYFRRENEFDKAMGIYEMILSDNKEDCESYWGIVLCRYGIEYVEDPRTHKRIPTVNRAQFTSIFDDEDFKKAIEYADTLQKVVYEEEAAVIDKIQKGILQISSKEEPFDVFICYKETDSSGNRTQDSVYAQDIYTALTKEGYKVFFSRITLEDKLGSAYEPYIFAALNSAKVMLVVGTNKDNFNAVWVKNEWSRFITLIKAGKEKTLIPVYKDISPYEMPEEFQYLQSQDMGKIGFMQDLVRGVSKLVDANKTTVKETVVVNSSNAQIEPLLKRVFMFLEDGDFSRADDFCEQVLNIEPECAEAYLGKLMAELKVKKQDDLVTSTTEYTDNINYQKAIKFANATLKEKLENSSKNVTYLSAIKAMKDANSEETFKSVSEIFDRINGYKDSDAKKAECLEKAEIARKDAIYEDAKAKMTGEEISTLAYAIELFKTIPGWKDADERILVCQKKIEEIKSKEEAVRLEYERKAEEARKAAEEQAKKKKKLTMIISSIVAVVLVFVIVLTTVIIPNSKYNDAIKLIESGKIVEAYEILISLDGYKDSTEKVKSILDDYKEEKIKTAKVGDFVYLGEFEQDNDESNGKELIEWQVVDEQDGKLLVISKYILARKSYNEEYNIAATWNTCSLRNWLNDDFYNSAFNSKEKGSILTTSVMPDINPINGESYGEITEDKVFIFSISEADKYFASDELRYCQPTETATVCQWWWLRTIGTRGKCTAAFVDETGRIDDGGAIFECSVTSGTVDVGVRPAMWVTIE